MGRATYHGRAVATQASGRQAAGDGKGTRGLEGVSERCTEMTVGLNVSRMEGGCPSPRGWDPSLCESSLVPAQGLPPAPWDKRMAA